MFDEIKKTEMLKILSVYKKDGMSVDRVLPLLNVTGTPIDANLRNWIMETYPTLGTEKFVSEGSREEHLDAWEKIIKANAEEDRLEQDLKRKKTRVDTVIYDQKLRDLEVLNNEKAAVDALDLDNLPQEYRDRSREEQENYLLAAKNRHRFILPSCDSVLPLFPKNLLLFGAVSGDGKSSTVAEAAECLLRQKSRATGKPCKVLVITNEETRGEVYARVCFLLKGWKYTRLDQFTDAQRETVSRFQEEMDRTKQLVVIDNNFGDVSQITTSVEGIDSIFQSIHKKKSHFDLIAIDYYQKVCVSKERPGMTTQDVLKRLSDLLDRYRKLLNSPIMVMTQLHPKTKGREDFQSRIKERKSIFESATFVAEIEPDRKNYKTHLHIQKNRLVQGTIGKTISFGYDRDLGRYVNLTPEFALKIAQWKKNDPISSVEDLLAEDDN